MVNIVTLNEIKDIFSRILDISLIAILVYYVYKNIINSYSANLLKGILILVAVAIAAYFLNLYTINWIVGYIINILPIAILILLNQEIKKIIMQFGNFNLNLKFNNKKEETIRTIDEIIKTVEYLSKNKIGSLICLEKKVQLNQIINKGIVLDALVSHELLISIFEYKTPLHDGAVIISKNRITYAGSFLPLSELDSISKTFGTRHRAGLGISENSDAITVITSEETGAASITNNGKLLYNLSLKEIRNKLNLILIE